MLSLHPEIDKKIRAEIEKYIPTLENLTFENLKKLKYFDHFQN